MHKPPRWVRFGLLTVVSRSDRPGRGQATDASTSTDPAGYGKGGFAAQSDK